MRSRRLSSEISHQAESHEVGLKLKGRLAFRLQVRSSCRGYSADELPDSGHLRMALVNGIHDTADRWPIADLFGRLCECGHQ